MKFPDYVRHCYQWPARIALFAIVAEMGFVSVAWSQEQPADPDSAAAGPEDSRDPAVQAADKLADISLLADGTLSENMWEFVSHEKDSRLAGTWQVKQSDGEAVLICRGEPYGYLKTTQAFANFQLNLEWKFPVDENGNSGILVYTNGKEKDKVWPTAIQVQLHQPVCGSIFPSGDAKADNEIRDVRDLCKAVNHWNLCEITSIDGRLSVVMNGKKVGVVTGCNPNQGRIALQSEGSEIHFRRIRVRKLAQGENPQPAVSQIVPRRVRLTRRFGSFAYSIPVQTSGPIEFVTFRPHHSRLQGITPHVVHRDRLAPDGSLVRARHRKHLVVVSTSAAPVSDPRAVMRSGHRRHLHR